MHLSDQTSSSLRQIASTKESSENLTTPVWRTGTRRTYVRICCRRRDQNGRETEKKGTGEKGKRRLLPTIKAIYSRVKVSFVGITGDHRSPPRDSPFLRLQLHPLPPPSLPPIVRLISRNRIIPRRNLDDSKHVRGSASTISLRIKRGMWLDAEESRKGIRKVKEKPERGWIRRVRNAGTETRKISFQELTSRNQTPRERTWIKTCR